MQPTEMAARNNGGMQPTEMAARNNGVHAVRILAYLHAIKQYFACFPKWKQAVRSGHGQDQ
jgi:hypothetical protein